MKTTLCEAVGCKCNSYFLVQRNWGKVDVIGFCKDHAPEWLKKLRVGESLPETTLMSISKSWYKRIA